MRGGSFIAPGCGGLILTFLGVCLGILALAWLFNRIDGLRREQDRASFSVAGDRFRVMSEWESLGDLDVEVVRDTWTMRDVAVFRPRTFLAPIAVQELHR